MAEAATIRQGRNGGRIQVVGPQAKTVEIACTNHVAKCATAALPLAMPADRLESA